MSKPPTTSSTSASASTFSSDEEAELDELWNTQPNSWCITRLRRPGIFLTWTISGFDTIANSLEHLRSSKFSLPGSSSIMFQLRLYRYYQSINVQCENVSQPPENHQQGVRYVPETMMGPFTLEVSILDVRGRKVNTRKAQFDTWERGTVHELERFVDNAALKERRQELLPNGNLTLLCKLHVSENVSYDAPCIDESVNDVCSPGSRLLSKYRTFLDSERLSDVELHVRGVTMRAHKLVLAAQSAVFDAMFAADMRESRTNVVVIDDVEPLVFRAFLGFLYTGELRLGEEWGKKGTDVERGEIQEERGEEDELERGIEDLGWGEKGELERGNEDIGWGEKGELERGKIQEKGDKKLRKGLEESMTSQNRLFDLHAAADKYEVEPLKELCEERLMRRLSVRRVVDVLMTARSRGGMGRLETHALHYIEVYIDRVMKSPRFRELECHQPAVVAEILRAVVEGRGS